jgi:hypothetical protein
MTSNHEKLVKWLESYPNGKYIQVFGDSSKPTDQDLLDAKHFADGMRKNVSDSKVCSVELSYNRVIVQLTLVPVGK